MLSINNPTGMESTRKSASPLFHWEFHSHSCPRTRSARNVRTNSERASHSWWTLHAPSRSDISSKVSKSSWLLLEHKRSMPTTLSLLSTRWLPASYSRGHDLAQACYRALRLKGRRPGPFLFDPWWGQSRSRLIQPGPGVLIPGRVDSDEEPQLSGSYLLQAVSQHCHAANNPRPVWAGAEESRQRCVPRQRRVWHRAH